MDRHRHGQGRASNGGGRVSPGLAAGGASLGGVGGLVVGAVWGFVATTVAAGTPTGGIQALVPLENALYGAAVGILVGGFGGFGGYWLGVKVAGGQAKLASLVLLAVFLGLAAFLAALLAGTPAFVPFADEGALDAQAGLALLVVPGPAALLAHWLGEQLVAP